MKNFWEKIKQNTLVYGRVIPAILMLVVFVSFISIGRLSFTYIFDNTAVFWVTRIITFLMFLAIASWGFLELTRAFLDKHPVYSVLILILLVCLFVNKNFSTLVFDNNVDNSKFITGFTNVKVFVTDYTVYLGAFISTVLFVLLRTFSAQNLSKKYLFYKAIYFFIASLILLIFYRGFIYLLIVDKIGIQYLILFLLIATGHDIGGFFGGKYLGHKFIKSKLAPTISPKKTWEGALVGVGVAIVIAISFAATWNVIDPYPWNFFNLLTEDIVFIDLINNSQSTSVSYKVITAFFLIFAPIFALLGDLFFSLIKRVCDIKDFSNIFRDHGGLLDRFDSIATVATLWFLFSYGL
ncbi:phosphatidate cytidylyltransferase [Mycoplasma corogypsi]|uniref:phosphatidate cytidylyltransferase n=1 Tax=Mycoplasma corogypsi TaxID=2106 RepID=UPI003873B4D2